MNAFLKKHLGGLAKLLISAGLVYFLLRKYDLAAALKEIKALKPGMLVLSLALVFGTIITASWRWLMLIRIFSKKEDAPSFKDIFAVNYVAQFSSLFLPATGGSDAVRVICLKRLGANLTETVSNVAIDRVLSFLTLIYAGLIGLPAGWKIEPFRPVLTVFVIAAAVGTGLLFSASFLSTIAFFKRFAWLERLCRDLKMLFAKPGSGLAVVAVGILSNVLFSLMYYTIAAGLDISVSVTSCLVLAPAIVLIILLPISVSGWGVREQAVITGFALVGMPPEQALLLSITVGAAVTLVSLPGFFFWLGLKRKSG